MDNGAGSACMESGVHGKSSYFPLKFAESQIVLINKAH